MGSNLLQPSIGAADIPGSKSNRGIKSQCGAKKKKKEESQGGISEPNSESHGDEF